MEKYWKLWNLTEDDYGLVKQEESYQWLSASKKSYQDVSSEEVAELANKFAEEIQATNITVNIRRDDVLIHFWDGETEIAMWMLSDNGWMLRKAATELQNIIDQATVTN